MAWWLMHLVEREMPMAERALGREATAEMAKQTSWNGSHWQMRRFKSAGQAQCFLTVYGLVVNLFQLGRHLTRASRYREFRSRAFCEWQEVTCAQIMA